MIDLFRKPTKTNQFLDSSSSHLYHYKKGIPYTQGSIEFALTTKVLKNIGTIWKDG